MTMKQLERKQEKERLERQIHQQMLKEQESTVYKGLHRVTV